MSLAGDRAAIAAALSTVDGVTGYAYRPATPLPGDGWPRLSSLDRADGNVFYAAWDVFILLPQDEREASDWLDSHHDFLVDALEASVGFVDRIEPVALSANGSEQFALHITMRGE